MADTGGFLSKLGGFGPFSAISAGIQLGSGILGKIQHDKYANLIEDQNLEMPGSMGKAESIYDMLASQGLPGKETIKSDIEGVIPANLSVAKEVVDSPSALIDLLGKSSAQTSDQMRKLGVNDATAKIQNQLALGRFLATAKAPMEMNINKFQIERDLSAQRERMAGWSELTQGFAGSANIGLKYFGDRANEEHMTTLMKLMTGNYKDDPVNEPPTPDADTQRQLELMGYSPDFNLNVS